MRLATYNVEWFSSLFDRSGNLFDDAAASSRHGVSRTRQTEALGTVFRALDADAVMVIEAPDQSRSRSTVAALETFARHHDLRTRSAVMGFPNDTRQEIALLYDPDRLEAWHDPVGEEDGTAQKGAAPRFDTAFRIDLDIDATEDLVRFSKPPLELRVRSKSGFEFRLIGVHLKSKAPHGASTAEEIMQLGIANRRKQLAQAIWLRARVVEHLSQGGPLVVMGDLNDGPGLDSFESLFGRSSVEIVLGEGDAEQRLYDPNAALALTRKLGAQPTTSRFWIEPEKRYLQALLDYIMVSPELRQRNPVWRIWHPMDDPACWSDPVLRDALIDASDHFPVTLDLAIS